MKIRVLNIISNLNLKWKMFITYVAIILICFVVFITFNNITIKKDLEQKYIYIAKQTFEQACSYLEYKLAAIKAYMDVLSTNSIIQDILKKPSSEYNENLGLWGYDIKRIEEQFNNANPSRDIMLTSIYTDKPLTLFGETVSVKQIQSLDIKLYQPILTRKESFLWFIQDNYRYADTYCISVIRGIQSPESYHDTMGLLRVDVRREMFTELLNNAKISKNSFFYFFDIYGTIFISSSQSNPDLDSFAASHINRFAPQNSSKSVWSINTFGKQSYLVGKRAIKNTPFSLVMIIPNSEFASTELRSYRKMIMLIILFCIAAVPVALMVANSSTRRIRSLIHYINSINNFNSTAAIPSSGKDEIGSLIKSFNAMLERISTLMDEKYEMGREIRAIELKALQAQINPHFLYNTLDLIYWKAVKNNDQSISDIILLLSRFYKLSLSSGNDIVTLENEIEHAKAYVQIQNSRFGNKIELIISIPDSLKMCKLPKITLQPLVENSIVHGIMEKTSQQGIIEIVAFQLQTECLVIEVRDDGIGMDCDKIKHMLAPHAASSSKGFGLSNIDRRIKLLYGEKYGLSFESIKGSGTTVICTIPFPGA